MPTRCEELQVAEDLLWDFLRAEAGMGGGGEGGRGGKGRGRGEGGGGEGSWGREGGARSRLAN